ncbi:hypothetical protein LOK49_LG10G00464 [Camellia lanceoleosa]|uniref:Uncharacterized protein n=1 Tax=Camellia lanceoleosa TaxID=1840588 RepID=A0ACC0GAB5_9ERIC|nr:hypothetical protein LOK49_LG10G00464 [Camellia lanceoleosa]
MDSSHKLWNERQLRNLVSGADCDAILSIPVSVIDKDDTLLWHYDSKGCYTVKSGTSLLAGVQFRLVDLCAFQLQNLLSTYCLTTNGPYEFGLGVILALDATIGTVFRLVNGLANVLRLWVAPTGVIVKAKGDEAEFLASCPATLTPQTGVDTIAVLLRDHTGQLVDGMVRKTRLRSVARCELLAIQHACLMADALNLTIAKIESDCKSVIQLCVSKGVPPWKLLALLCDVRSLASRRSLAFRWCPRQANRAAH